MELSRGWNGTMLERLTTQCLACKVQWKLADRMMKVMMGQWGFRCGLCWDIWQATSPILWGAERRERPSLKGRNSHSHTASTHHCHNTSLNPGELHPTSLQQPRFKLMDTHLEFLFHRQDLRKWQNGGAWSRAEWPLLQVWDSSTVPLQ